MKWLQRVKKWWQDAGEKRASGLLVAVGLAGMALIALSEWLPGEPPGTGAGQAGAAQSQAAGQGEDYAARLEQRLAALLACQNGVGRVRVMVTLVSDEQTVYARDKAYDGAALREESHVLVSGSGAPALVETVEAPQILGIAVICDGGGNAAVAGSVTQILAALTGVGASHISVTQMVPAHSAAE